VADVRPFRALRYTGVAGPLGGLVAPPYDVIDLEQRAQLLERSPYNAVAIDLPKPYGQAGPQETGGDPYATAARLIEEWRAKGALVDDAEPAIWAMSQGYTGPDGEPRTRHGILCRVRVEDFEAGQVLPHERTLPGPKKDRLDLTRATRHNLSPIFSLSTEDPWPLVAQRIEGTEPWGEATDEAGVTTKLWRVGDPGTLTAVSELLSAARLLIADGHHRYETAIAYRDEVGGEDREAPHHFTLMALTGLADPGLTVFPTHRLLSGFADDPERQRALGEGLRELFDAEEVSEDELDPRGVEGVGVFGLYDNFHKKAFRLRLKDEAIAALDEQLAGKPEAFRRLDAAILETLVLKGIAGMSEDDILAKRGIGYTKNLEDTRRLLDDGSFDVAFVLRPIPVDQVRAICESDENMPPKSTFFYPKVLTGLVFNPVG
jgi:uncharacterized protein (DUF1015 family)